MRYFSIYFHEEAVKWHHNYTTSQDKHQRTWILVKSNFKDQFNATAAKVQLGDELHTPKQKLFESLIEFLNQVDDLFKFGGSEYGRGKYCAVRESKVMHFIRTPYKCPQKTSIRLLQKERTWF